jgi:hypothetical protein
MLAAIMTWLTWLVLAVVVTAVAALTGVKPKGTRHVARTRLMGVARVVLGWSRSSWRTWCFGLAPAAERAIPLTSEAEAQVLLPGGSCERVRPSV